jgi:hypothetical protein
MQNVTFNKTRSATNVSHITAPLYELNKLVISVLVSGYDALDRLGLTAEPS